MNDKIDNYVFFDIIVNFIIQTHFPQKIYKLSKNNIFFSRFVGTRGEKTNKYFTPKKRVRKPKGKLKNENSSLMNTNLKTAPVQNFVSSQNII